MRRDETHTVFSFLCWGCLNTLDVAVPTTPNIYTDIEAAESRLVSQGWTTIEDYPRVRHYCEWCRRKGRIPKIERY